MRQLAGFLLVALFVSVLLAVFPVHARDIGAGPIWNNSDAQNKCPSVCAGASGTWNGNWRTVVPGRKSVCDCDFTQHRRGKEDFNAGPIWNDQHAAAVCPAVCVSHDRAWKGEWHTTVQGRMSACTCQRG
jgi:mannan-binding protein